MKRSSILPVILPLLFVACSHRKDTAPADPKQGSDPIDTVVEEDIEESVLVPEDAYAEWAAPLFDDGDYYLVVEEVPVPVVTSAPADLDDLEDVDVAIFIEPDLAQMCGMDPSVTFAANSQKLSHTGKQTLADLAKCLAKPELETASVTLTGYTDPRGASLYKRALGLERAGAVENALVADGVADNRISIASAGQQLTSDDPKDWANDRRVVVRLDD